MTLTSLFFVLCKHVGGSRCLDNVFQLPKGSQTSYSWTSFTCVAMSSIILKSVFLRYSALVSAGGVGLGNPFLEMVPLGNGLAVAF